MIGKALKAWVASEAAITAILGAAPATRFRPAGGFKQGEAFPRTSYQVITGGSASQRLGGLGGLHRAQVQITCTDRGHTGYQDAVDLALLFIGTDAAPKLGAYAGGTLGGVVVRSAELVPDSWGEVSIPPDDRSGEWIHEVAFDLLIMFVR